MTIKRFPEDFRVEEMLAPATAAAVRSGTGPFALYRLSKEGLGTDEAIERAARELRVPAGAVAYVGLKDKHASTSQYVTVAAPPGGLAELPSAVTKPNWRLERFGWLDRPLEPANVSGNSFRIVIRRLTRRRSAAIDERARFLAAPAADAAAMGPPAEGATAVGAAQEGSALRIVNYFGEQRFGSARHGKGFAARHLVRGEFEEALRLLIAEPARKDTRRVKETKRALAAAWGDWRTLSRSLPAGIERDAVLRLAATGGDFREAFAALPPFLARMAVEAYQGWLWNETARRIVERLDVPKIAVKSRYGAILFPEPSRVPGDISRAVMPLFSPNMPLEEPWGAAADEVFAAEGLTAGDLRIPGLRRPFFGDTPRGLFVDASGWKCGRMELDESSEDRRRFKRSVKFFLPRGSYGTVLIAALTAP